MPSPAKLPRWRGFNLLDKFIAASENAPFKEQDFEWMARWGFDFARLPMSYLCWSSHKDWRQMDEKALREIDQAVEWGRQYGVHVSLNFHRAPGYSVDTSTPEPFNLWTDAEALEACCYHWAAFARRYKGVPSSVLSFDLVNEPAYKTWKPAVMLDDATYTRVARALVEAIRGESPDRLIIADGLLWGNLPVPSLADLHIAQSMHDYQPHHLTHWKAGWVEGSDTWDKPTWPLPVDDPAKARAYYAQLATTFKDNPIVARDIGAIDPTAPWDAARIRAEQIKPWKDLEAMGVGVHVGEFGVYNKTPHDVAMAWLTDTLAAFKEAGWGWALWNLRGDFGIVDSGRADVDYEDFHGHKLDRKMLELLQAN